MMRQRNGKQNPTAELDKAPCLHELWRMLRQKPLKIEGESWCGLTLLQYVKFVRLIIHKILKYAVRQPVRDDITRT